MCSVSARETYRFGSVVVGSTMLTHLDGARDGDHEGWNGGYMLVAEA